MPAKPREHLNRTRLGTLQHGSKATDHAAGTLGQGQLDRPVQILDDITQPASNIKNHYLTHDARSDPCVRATARTAGWARRELDGWQATDVTVTIGGKVGDIGRRLHHGELDSVVPESRIPATKSRKRHEEGPTPPGSVETPQFGRYTPHTPETL
jgi:hypothetical protein